MDQRSVKRGARLAAALAIGTLASCGYTEQQWQAQLDKYERLATKERVNEEKLDRITADLELERDRIKELEGKMKALGIDIESKNAAIADLGTTLADRERALAEYKLKAKQLEAIKARFDLLRSKLNELTKLGLEVRIRKNRMVISLPGDVLFDSGRDTLKKEGRDILTKVAAVIAADPALMQRDYQVAGHTDSKALKGGAFVDNWGLSVMRARQVLVFLVDPAAGKLPTAHWSAAGYADMDPIAPNDTDEGRQANRRCELIVLPSVEEMLDLRSIASGDQPKGDRPKVDQPKVEPPKGDQPKVEPPKNPPKTEQPKAEPPKDKKNP